MRQLIQRKSNLHLPRVWVQKESVLRILGLKKPLIFYKVRSKIPKAKMSVHCLVNILQKSYESMITELVCGCSIKFITFFFEAEMDRQQYEAQPQYPSRQLPLQTSKRQQASTSSQYLYSRSDSASTSYSYSPSPTSCTPSPLQSPQDNENVTQTKDLLSLQPPLQTLAQCSASKLTSKNYGYSPSPTLSPLESPQYSQVVIQLEDLPLEPPQQTSCQYSAPRLASNEANKDIRQSQELNDFPSVQKYFASFN